MTESDTSQLGEYKAHVTTRLEQLSPLLQDYALGDFSKTIQVPDEEDEFTELLVGLNLMVEERTNELQQEITERARAEQELKQKMEELQRFNRLAVGRELRMVELKQEVNELAEELGRESPYNVSFADP
jgi:HAMP domain-containing protein